MVFVEANIDLGSHPEYPGVQTLDAFVPNVQVVRFPEAGHYMQHENSKEVAAEIKKFVDRIVDHGWEDTDAYTTR